MSATKPSSYQQGSCRIYPPPPGKGSWRVRWMQDGKQQERTFTTQALADENARLISADVARGRTAGEVNLTIEEVARAYVDSLPPGRYRERQHNSLRAWVIPHIGKKNLLAWTVHDSKAILRKMDAKDLSESYKRNIGAVMRALVTFAREKRWLRAIDDDPMLGVKYTPKSTIQGESVLYVPRDTLPTEDQLQALFAAGPGHWPLAWEFKARSGVRWGELAALRPGDLDLDRRIVVIERSLEETCGGSLRMKTTKNRKVRHSIIPQSLVEPLRAQQERVLTTHGPLGHLFHALRGGPARRPVHRKIWQAAAEKAGWTSPWTPHDLRHVAACWMLFDLKAEPVQVAYWLGHHSPAFTSARYLGIRGDILEAGFGLTEGW